jgi:hypothetical protein
MPALSKTIEAGWYGGSGNMEFRRDIKEIRWPN